jgi:hypothetical protein
MRFIKYIFTPNYEKYEGVRPINIYLLRLIYFLMLIGVATDAWSGIFTHQGPWDHHRAMNTAVWAAYTTLGFFGLINPLRWLPIVIFMIFYKTLWLIMVALPLWKAGALAGSPAEEMARVYMGAPLIILFVPWIYVFKNYVMWSKSK